MAERWQAYIPPRVRSQTSFPKLECGHQQLVIDDQHWPLRLIDISATLDCGGGIIFTAKQNWDFHVISHTWSRSIREFSEKVGKSLEPSTGPAHDQYNEAFGRADFSAEDGYIDLLNFLKILMADGVKYVWFDALCINQMDYDEKGREIMHMGAYYRHSRGCYVVNHGIGQGYELLGLDKDKNELCLPRWFTRVRTLQEFLLPTELMFLVSHLRREVISGINEQIKRHSHVVGFCNCCLWSEWILFFCNCCKVPYWQCKNRRGVGDEEGEEIIGSEENKLVMCTKCKSLPLIRKAEGHGIEPDGQLYFVERSAYQRLVSIHLAGPFFGDQQVLGTSRMHQSLMLPHLNLKSWQLHFSQLYRLLASKCFTCEITLYASLIQSRDCSVKHQEDRVLSVLCLLGLEGSMQVRTGQTLEQQWVEVARELLAKARVRQLLDLCIQNIKSSWQPNASWIPNYCEFDNACWLGMIRLRSELVQVKEVTKEGALRLQGMAVPARLVRRGSKWKEHNSSHPLARTYCSSCQHFSSVHRTWSRVHQQAMCHLETGGNQLCIPLVANAYFEEKRIGEATAR